MWNSYDARSDPRLRRGNEVPEAAKPRTIKIGTTVETVQPQVTQQKAA
jgi:hypothetical protein